MQLLLLSLGLGAVAELLPPSAKIGFVPTAGEPYEDPYFVREDRDRLAKLGYNLLDLNISSGNPSDIKKALGEIDALFVAGGNTFYLMQQIRQKELAEAFSQFMISDRLYIGASAGAAICGPTLQPFVKLDDPSKAPSLHTMAGLGVINFVVLPHYGKTKHLDKYHAIMKEHAESVRIVPLRDDEALYFSRPDRYEMRSSTKILHEA